MPGPTPQAKLAGGAEVGGSPDPAIRGDLMLTDDSAEASLRAMWPLVFSREEAIREAVVDAVYNLYLKDGEGGCSRRGVQPVPQGRGRWEQYDCASRRRVLESRPSDCIAQPDESFLIIAEPFDEPPVSLRT